MAEKLMTLTERKNGRFLASGFPPGVGVADTMLHGISNHASTNFRATSSGKLANRRFLRPIGYQKLRDALSPVDLA